MEQWLVVPFLRVKGYAARAQIGHRLESLMGGMLPLSPLGISFSARGRSGRADATESIVVRCNTAIHDLAYDLGHGVCALCCRYLPELPQCPCGMYEHDHAFSLCIRTVDEPHRRARICRQCARQFLSSKIVQVKLGSKYCECFAASGDLIYKCDLSEPPGTYEELLSHIVEDLADEYEEYRYATDGFAYTHAEFHSYYGTNYEIMWKRAYWRSNDIQLIYKTSLLSSKNFHVFRQDLHPPFTASASLGTTTRLHELPGMHDYIPCHYWPHEPMELDDVETEGWLQVSPAQETVAEFICGKTGSEQLNIFFRSKFDSLVAERQHLEPPLAIAYSTHMGHFFCKESVRLWPHVYLHAIVSDASDVLELTQARLADLVEEWFPFTMARRPPASHQRFGRYPPHFIAAQSSDEYHNARFFSTINYELLCNSWQGGIAGIARMRDGLIDILGRRGFAN